MGAGRPCPRPRRRQVDPAHRARSRRRPAPLRRAPARAAGNLDGAAAFAAEPHGRRRSAHPPAVSRGAAARGLRADRARARPAPRHRRPGPLGLPLGLGAAPSRRSDRRRRDPALRPGLDVSPSLRGSVELVVMRGVDAEDIYLLHAADGTVTYEERSAPEADAHVLGPERAWVEAFGVDGSRTELEFTGDTRLAEALLDEVVAGVARNRAVA